MKSHTSNIGLLVIGMVAAGCHASSNATESDPVVRFSLRAGTFPSLNLQRGDSVQLSALAIHASGAIDTARTGLTLVSTDTAVVVARATATVVAVGLGSSHVIGALDVDGHALRDSVAVFVGIGAAAARGVGASDPKAPKS
jgi:hypothetical protein